MSGLKKFLTSRDYCQKTLWAKLLLLITVLMMAGCSTTGHFIIPEGTQLEVYERPINVPSSGRVKMRPFFWSAAGVAPQGGCSYLLLKDDKIIKEGNLRVVFRPWSMFWPPFAIIYWPMGLNPNITYDLVNDTQE
jgi:hypothetical protein